MLCEQTQFGQLYQEALRFNAKPDQGEKMDVTQTKYADGRRTDLQNKTPSNAWKAVELSTEHFWWNGGH